MANDNTISPCGVEGHTSCGRFRPWSPEEKIEHIQYNCQQWHKIGCNCHLEKAKNIRTQSGK